ncbi:hypothetical protein CYB_2495 [Synechococcus sp. JA-2-3B'a(2-13)]|nr:hypothetical protein CYB_2495 [Synechococcus sp. JA-2-3B'a(2-13)]
MGAHLPARSGILLLLHWRCAGQKKRRSGKLLVGGEQFWPKMNPRTGI